MDDVFCKKSRLLLVVLCFGRDRTSQFAGVSFHPTYCLGEIVTQHSEEEGGCVCLLHGELSDENALIEKLRAEAQLSFFGT